MSRSPKRRRILLAPAAVVLIAAGALVWVQGEATTTPAPPDGPAMKLHESFLERAKEGNIDLLFLGDSITRGWADNEVWERFYAPRNAANFGIDGDRTEHVLWRLEHGEVEGIRPKVVVLMIGVNNSGSNTAEAIADGVTAIVKSLREKLPETKILLLGILPRGEWPRSYRNVLSGVLRRGEWPGPIRDKLAAVNAQIAQLDDGEMIKYLDIGKSFVQEDGTIARDLMPDSLHLSPEGYRIWADAMEPTLQAMLGGGRPAGSE